MDLCFSYILGTTKFSSIFRLKQMKECQLLLKVKFLFYLKDINIIITSIKGKITLQIKLF